MTVKENGSNTDIFKPLELRFEDDQWPLYHDEYSKRRIVRALVYVPNRDRFAFVRVERHDIFGDGRFIETSGGGIEEGEDEIGALKRELGEELGYEVAVITKLGTVTDFYNLIGRQNIQSYYLVRTLKETAPHLTEEESDAFHLRPLFLTLDEALAEYDRCAVGKLGVLLARREKPVIEKVKNMLEVL